MKRTKDTFISVVIPVYNEEKRINNLTTIISYLKKQKYKSEVIVVNDGSTDKTYKLLKLLKLKLNFKLFSYNKNLGKGYAIKTGMLNSRGKYRLFLDIDLSTPIEEVDKMLPHLKKNDIVIGSRKMESSNLIVRQPYAREFLGKIFTLLSQIILQMGITDFTCGFKCFSRESAEQIFPRQRINRWGFDSEILYLAKKGKYSIKEIPITWKDDKRTKVKFPQDILSSLGELLKIRLNSYRDLYK